jgi:hypothetical protein
VSERLPRAWRGRERVVAHLLAARVATRIEDAHRELLSELMVQCFSLRTFPSASKLSDATGDICEAIKDQVFRDGPVPADPDGRLRQIVARLCRATGSRPCPGSM